MAASNDSQGLKIAVAAFVSLTVILAVSCYFLYSNYSQTDALLTKAKSEAKSAKDAQSLALRQLDDLRKAVGTRAEDFDAATAEMKKSQKDIDDKVAGIPKKVDEVVAKAQAAGLTGPEIQEHRDTIKRLIQEYQGEVNKTYISSLNRMTDIYENLDYLYTSLAMNYAGLRRSLESSNTVNKSQTDALAKTVADLRADLEGESKKHMELRADLNQKVDTLQTERDAVTTELQTAKAEINTLKAKAEKDLKLAHEIIREQRDKLERSESVLDVPDGHVTFVDYRRNEVHTDVTRSMGARPQMVLSIFDKHAAGIPTDKPKGTIELIQVGERGSIAKITKMFVSTDPIRLGDIVHSAAWSPNEPMRFALIGKIDINRDGRDDRGDLKRMIEAAGGIVDYDLPPPFAGKEAGQLSARDAWYVFQDKPPIRTPHAKAEDENRPENVEFAKKMSDAIREARQDGVRPMPVSRLLAYLGYNFAAPVVGRVQAYDAESIKGLLRARQAGEGLSKPAAATEPDAEKAQEKGKAKEDGDEMKDEKGDKGAEKADKADKDAEEKEKDEKK